MTREPLLPATRAAVFTAVCVGLSVAAHRAMSAVAIPAWAMILGGVGVYAAARIGSRRERGLVGIAALMGVLQVALHVLFAYAQNVSAAQDASAAMPGMSMPDMPMATTMALAHSGAGIHMGSGIGMGSGMLIGHVLAALVCSWWLRRGEAAVHAVARCTARWVVEHLVVRLRAVPIPAVAQSVRRVRPTACAMRAQWLLTSVVLRGPPSSSLFA